MAALLIAGRNLTLVAAFSMISTVIALPLFSKMAITFCTDVKMTKGLNLKT